MYLNIHEGLRRDGVKVFSPSSRFIPVVDETGRSFHPYAKTPPPGYSSDGSNDNVGFSKFYSDLKDNVEKRRSGGWVRVLGPRVSVYF